MPALAGFEALLNDSDYIQKLKETYSDLDVERELGKMRVWLDANPRHRYRNYKRFVVNWLNKEDRYGKRADRGEAKRKYADLSERDVKRYSPKDPG